MTQAQTAKENRMLVQNSRRMTPGDKIDGVEGAPDHVQNLVL